MECVLRMYLITLSNQVNRRLSSQMNRFIILHLHCGPYQNAYSSVPIFYQALSNHWLHSSSCEKCSGYAYSAVVFKIFEILSLTTFTYPKNDVPLLSPSNFQITFFFSSTHYVMLCRIAFACKVPERHGLNISCFKMRAFTCTKLEIIFFLFQF